jgi:hypothetical protein
VFSLGHLPPFSLQAVFVFCHSGDNFPLPEAKLGLVFRGSSGPRGSSFYGGFDAPSGTSSDDGLGTRQPILRKLGPLPAQMGGMQLAAWIHLTSRNLSCFPWAQFSQSRPLRVAELLSSNAMAYQARVCFFRSGLYTFLSQGGGRPHEKRPAVRSVWLGGTSFATMAVCGWSMSNFWFTLVDADRRTGLRRSATRAAVGQRYGWRPGLETGSVFFADSRVLPMR